MKKAFILILSLYSFLACEKEPETKKPIALETKIVSNINASLANYQLFSFATGDTVPIADSATTKWDIGFKTTTIIFNGGTSGPGNAGVIIKDALFSEVKVADESGYVQDNASAKAIPTGSDNGWYNYSGDPTHLITPLAGKVFVVKTATGNYAKFQVISYYKDAPATPVYTEGSKYYTIRYVYQPDGSKDLK